MKGDEPAFPQFPVYRTNKGRDDDAVSHPDDAPTGVSVRLWLAAQAMQGLLANPSLDQLTFDEIASDALGYADAMLKQSEVGR